MGASIERIMSSPKFALGVADVRAGRSFPANYDKWGKGDDVRGYERGRMWARLTPRNAPRAIASRRLSIAGTSSLRVINECIDGPLYVRHSWKMKNEINGESAEEACPHLLSDPQPPPSGR